MNAIAIRARHYRIAEFYALTKPRIAFLVVVATILGYLAGAPTSIDGAVLLHLFVGTFFAAGAAGALNQYLERDADGRMRRTMGRPIPAGRVSAGEALQFGLGLAVFSVVYLFMFVNALTAALAVATLTSYLLFYTPMKRLTSLSTIIGAIPGALPPVGGWAAARNDLSIGAWVLFAILFLWQLPHFLAIGWMCRDDYARAGFPMLPVLDPTGAATGRQIALYTLVLVPVSLAPSVFGFAGSVYFVGALAFGCVFLCVSLAMAVARSTPAARRLLLASVLYLPALLGLLVLDRVPGGFPN